MRKCANLLFGQFFPENCLKMKKNGPGRPLIPPQSANAKASSQVEHFHEQREHTCVSFCHSVHGGGVSVPACTTDHITRGSLSRVVSAQGGLCPGWSVSRVVFVQGVSVQGVSVQGESLCPGGSLSGRLSYGNEWVVRIPLECIFVSRRNFVTKTLF